MFTKPIVVCFLLFLYFPLSILSFLCPSFLCTLPAPYNDIFYSLTQQVHPKLGLRTSYSAFSSQFSSAWCTKVHWLGSFETLTATCPAFSAAPSCLVIKKETFQPAPQKGNMTFLHTLSSEDIEAGLPCRFLENLTSKHIFILPISRYRKPLLWRC